MACVFPWVLFAVIWGLSRLLRRRRGAEYSPRAERASVPQFDGTVALSDLVEGAYTVPDTDERTRRGYRRMLRDMYDICPRERVLSDREHAELVASIFGRPPIWGHGPQREW